MVEAVLLWRGLPEAIQNLGGVASGVRVKSCFLPLLDQAVLE